jgi:hypothetical protein
MNLFLKNVCFYLDFQTNSHFLNWLEFKKFFYLLDFDKKKSNKFY